MKAIIIISIILIIVIAGTLFFFFSSGPVYKPGRMKHRKDFEAFITPPSQADVKPGFWKVQENISLYHFTDGSGAPVLVVHGGPGYPFPGVWKGLALLDKEYGFNYYHQRGCGQSTRPADKFKSDNYYRNMLMLIDSLGIEQSIADIERIRRILKQNQLIIIGHSYGGFIAALYAIEFPDRVKKLVLVSPADVLKLPPADGGLYQRVKNFLPEGKIRGEYDDYLKRFFDYGNIFKNDENSLSVLNEEFIRYYAAALRNKGLIDDETKVSVKGIGGWVTPALFLSLGRTYDITPSLNSIVCPVLIIHGDNDMVMDLKAENTYKENIKNAGLITIKGTGHESFNDKPEEFAKIVRRFLQK